MGTAELSPDEATTDVADQLRCTMDPDAQVIIANCKAADASRSSRASAHSSGCSKIRTAL
jgi:hypothetical protein